MHFFVESIKRNTVQKFLQGRNRDADVDNRHKEDTGKGEGGND